jgi:hypothetical protein
MGLQIITTPNNATENGDTKQLANKLNKSVSAILKLLFSTATMLMLLLPT